MGWADATRQDSLRYPSGTPHCGIRQNPLARPRFGTRIASLSDGVMRNPSEAC